MPWVTIRHYLSLDRAEIEQECAAYLATHGVNLDVLRKAADIAMYQAKDRGRHAVSVFSGSPV